MRRFKESSWFKHCKQGKSCGGRGLQKASHKESGSTELCEKELEKQNLAPNSTKQRSGDCLMFVKVRA